MLTKRTFEVLHYNLFSLVKTTSLGGKEYSFVIVYEFSGFTWVLFVNHKDDFFEAFQNFYKRVQNKKNIHIILVISDHRGEFINSSFMILYDDNYISHNLSCPRIPQRVAERNSRTLQEIEKTILNESNVEKYFWAEVINTSCYVFVLKELFKACQQCTMIKITKCFICFWVGEMNGPPFI